jgi:formylglycine-generating enzyme required for sulfatase activity
MRRPLLFAIAALALVAGCQRKPAEEASTDTPQAVAAQIVMSDIPGGTFTMGVPPDQGFQNGYPPHDVTVRPFRMGKFEVTFDQYDAFARATGRLLPGDEGWGRAGRPAIHVSWQDAQAFIAWLNEGGKRRFRLPSEAEWEYAARGGTTTPYYWGDKPDPNFANGSANTGADKWTDTAPVGQFPANAFGLHDMLGNVWELVADCRHPTYDGAPTDGSARVDGDCDSRIARGGNYGSTTRGLQAAARGAAGETFDSMGLGFRLAEDAAPAAKP